MKQSKTNIYLVSDSTVQSYEDNFYPQTGWGQVFVQFFKDGDKYVEEAVTDCPYPQARIYETPDLHIENRAIGGRSSRSFIEEGKWDNLLPKLKEGDFVFLQFGHNDATINRPERYVASEDFPKFIHKYINDCKAKNATCVLITPVARRNCEEDGIFHISFLPYREVMLTISEEENIPLLDLGKHSTAFCNAYGTEESKELFLWVKAGEYKDSAYAEGVNDNTHLQKKGALAFANIVAALIAKYDKDNQLDQLKSLVAPKSLSPLDSL